MSLPGQGMEIRHTADLLTKLLREIFLIARLMLDRRVPLWVKLIPVLTALYILSPIDLSPDPILGLGQLDDTLTLLIGLNLFLALCPREVVDQLRRGAKREGTPDSEAEVIDTTYRVLDD
ncbi:MAG: YkvA family protein [Anaerolineae bacterium]